MKKLLIFIVCYNHEQFIERVINRIPDSLLCDENLQTEILIIDDQSKDNTFNKAVEYANCHENLKITVLYNPVNQGYGGNQKIGYYYAIQNNFDAVVLLHGDGQYAPEFLPKMVQPIFSDQADVVLGSRMVHKSEALKGKMPLYKWLGNQFLTTTQNFLLKSNLSEFHTGYRAFRVSALKTIPYDCNSNYYDFDTEILIQLLDTKFRITDTPIPTYYGDEISYVNSVTYGFLILWATVLSRLVKLGILYNPKFSYEDSNTQYLLKLGFPSSHQFAIDSVPQGATLIDAGCGPGYMARELRKKGCKVISIDQSIQELARQSSYKTIEADIDKFDFCSINEKVDVVFLLDIIEHLKSPEQVLMNIREAYCFYSPQVIITTGNIAFFPLRVFLMYPGFYSHKTIYN
jgi:glycosyltransferase involved in cell wall biosynthesis